MEQYFNKIFNNIHYETSLSLLLSLIDSNTLVQAGFTNDENNFNKNTSLQKIKRQVDLKRYVAVDLLEKQFSV